MGTWYPLRSSRASRRGAPLERERRKHGVTEATEDETGDGSWVLALHEKETRNNNREQRQEAGNGHVVAAATESKLVRFYPSKRLSNLTTFTSDRATGYMGDDLDRARG